MVRTAAAILASALLLAACGGQRPLHIVQRDADFAYKRGDYSTAVNDYNEFVTRKPDNVEMRYMLARSQTANGQPRQAMENLFVCLDINPLNDNYLDAMAEAMYAAGERDALTAFLARTASERQRVKDYLRQGNYAVKLGNLDEAQQAYITAAKIDQGRTVRPQLALAEFYGRIGDRQKQVRRLRMAYFIEPANPDALAMARELGEITGPTYGLPPEELESR